MNKRFVLLAAVALALASGVARADDWGTLGLDGPRSRLSAERSGARFEDGRWSFAPRTGARALSSPVVADGYVASVDIDGTLSVLAADTGAPVWQAQAGIAVQGTPAITRGRVFVPTLGNKLAAFALADGTPLWTDDLGGTTISSPAALGTDIVVSAGFPTHRVVRLDGATGAVVWQSPAIIDQPGNSSPAIGSGLVVVGSNGGHLYAFDAATGGARWDYQADGVVHLASPLIAAGRVYLAGGDQSDKVHAIDLASGVALAGWPVTLPASDPDVAGSLLGRYRAVSSFALAGGHLVLQTRLDDILDTDGDGVANQYLSREIVVALDPTTGAIVWQVPLARRLFTDPNDVPKFFVCPTPAAFGTDGGAPLLAVASSLVATVRVLDPATGNDLGDLSVAGRALASPAFANGRLITVAENGTVEGRLSSVNRPPAAPILDPNPRPLDASDVTLRWQPAVDPDGETPIYELRIDGDGEVLRTYAQQIFSTPGATFVPVVVPLAAGVTYTFAVRARDPHGAYSPWSAPETFTVATAGAVTVNGTVESNLRAAVANALPGDRIVLGAGTYPLSKTLHVGAGVSLQGAGAGRTVIDATGLSVGVSFGATDLKGNSGLDGTTVVGADTCIAVAAGATGIRLSHLVVRECGAIGIAVAAGASGAILNATLVGNGTAVDSGGSATIKNSILTGNAVGLAGHTAGALVSTFDDLFDNTVAYQGLVAGTGDFAARLTFVDPARHDFGLPGPGASTDQGDPGDDASAEPSPNGARINLGAFGGTADAEISTPVPVGDPTGRPPAPAAPTAGAPSAHEGDQEEGCASGGQSRGGTHSPLAGLLVFGILIELSRRTRRTSKSSSTNSSRR
jgi:outer membrane protein assembly factor BamB